MASHSDEVGVGGFEGKPGVAQYLIESELASLIDQAESFIINHKAAF